MSFDYRAITLYSKQNYYIFSNSGTMSLSIIFYNFSLIIFILLVICLSMNNLKKILNFGENSFKNLAQTTTALNDNFITAIDSTFPEN